jgi:hypothetical protein
VSLLVRPAHPVSDLFSTTTRRLVEAASAAASRRCLWVEIVPTSNILVCIWEHGEPRFRNYYRSGQETTITLPVGDEVSFG